MSLPLFKPKHTKQVPKKRVGVYNVCVIDEYLFPINYF